VGAREEFSAEQIAQALSTYANRFYEKLGPRGSDASTNRQK